MALAAYGNPRFRFGFVQLDTNVGFRFEYPKESTLIDLEYPTATQVTAMYAAHEHFMYEYCQSLGVARRTPGVDLELLSGRSVYGEIDCNAGDLAASAQDLVENALVYLVRSFLNRLRVRRLCIAGGVAMNCKALGRLLKDIPELEEVFVPPVANDAGGALGAAMEVFTLRGGPSSRRLTHAYWGPEFDDAAVESVMTSLGWKSQFLSDPSATAVDLIARGAIVGWFQGRMEVGARALGNRSILADPSSVQLRASINKEVKNRECWRPFSPSILAGSSDEQHWERGDCASPFMSIALMRSTDGHSLTGVTHVDGTSRVQAVAPNTNERYEAVLSGLRQLTGTGVVLNTSLNGNGEPMPASPVDAVKLFAGSAMDALIVGRSLLLKEGLALRLAMT